VLNKMLIPVHLQYPQMSFSHMQYKKIKEFKTVQ
jgi:hypothetical protein